MWLSSAIEYKKYGYTILLKAYGGNEKELRTIINNLDKGFSFLIDKKEKYIPIAKFSSEITKDSHYFDIDNTPGKLLLSAFGYLKDKKWATAEAINELLMSFGIIRDEISNFTITSGLLAFDEAAEIEGFKWFRRYNEPLLLNIYNLNSIGCIKGIKDVAFVFENPTVFYELMIKTKEIPVSLICTSGQPNISSLILLDKLTENGTLIYYSGDFDPEGMQIADNLLYRYGENIEPLGMSVDNYLKIKGKNSFAERAGKLDTIVSDKFKDVIVEMKKYETAGYQELLSDYYFEEIKNILNL